MQNLKFKISAKNSKIIIRLVGLILAAALFFLGIHQTISSPSQVQQKSPLPIAASGSAQAAEIPGLEMAPVTRVVDGDTIEINLNGTIEKVRLTGINTPETVDPRKGVECFGHEASDATKQLLTGKSVFLEKDVEDRDKYNRLLRYVYLKVDESNLVFVNDYLVREGFAQIDTFPPNVKYVNRFTEAQIQAREQNKGLWVKCK